MAPVGKIDAKSVLDEGIRLIFKDWSVIRIILENECGGDETEEKVEWMREVLVDELCNSRNNAWACSLTYSVQMVRKCTKTT